MGDRYKRTRPTGDEAKKKPKSKKSHSESSSYELSKLKGKSLLSEGVEQMVGIMYTPKTPETRHTYEALLTFIQEVLGDQPRDVLCGAADEILITVKNDRLREKEKKRDVEQLLGAQLVDEKYAVLINLSRKITDFGGEEKVQPTSEENIDDTYGVNVQFEESDEDDDDMMDEVKEEEDDIDEDEAEPAPAAVLHARNLDSAGTASVVPGGRPGTVLHPRDIDAHWLQRKLRGTYDDPVVARSKASEVLEVLKTAVDERDAESQLVQLLGFDQFDFIKTLREHRQMVLYCTLLASAQTASEKVKIRETMAANPQLARILRALESTGEDTEEVQTRADEHTKRKEAAEELGENQFAKYKLLDLDDLTFAQGSHFMANKRCQLPEGTYRKQQKGYEEIHVPALQPRPFDSNEVSESGTMAAPFSNECQWKPSAN